MRRSFLIVSLFVILAALLFLPGLAGAGTLYRGITVQDRILVPLRSVLEAFGASVGWDGSEITVQKGDRVVSLKAGSSRARVEGKETLLDVPPRVVDSITYIPLRFVSEAFGATVGWYEKTGTATVSLDGKFVQVKLSNGGSAGIKQYSRQVGHIRATVVEIPPGAPVRAVVALARDRVGATEDLASIANRYGAAAAINGTFFEAYGGIPEPWGTIIRDGKVVHVGNVGSVVGITSDGRVKMDTVRIKVEGGTGGSYEWPDNWYAYGFNRTPRSDGSAAYIYTRERGSSLGFAYGTSVVVSGGKVVRVVEGQDVTIPGDGFVINLTGSERYMRDRFEPGKSASYRIVFEDMNGNRLDWSDVVTAVGAGPRLLTGGRITVDPAGEGFTSAKILTGGGARSAIGVKSDGSILLVTVPGATINQLASVMKELGAVDAMNLDGGASSGLYYKDRYLTTPGRRISNALLFIPAH
ncbi:phosphodiester glycosidase family protein [Desulfallas sp. Bu1-1]|uniref:phosphodiester glycosidase family protein n=1 Tax=Desulfallas sp. Bu1-1 TaxID=2787620 RepID=UPI00189F8667|nr:phosphodiester glycosidase family protein [Desulfallas sp. Bu1-1]MBF7083101.1 phosphodiester glycosidase family protein [Desulfallas sp. Bu1-1]